MYKKKLFLYLKSLLKDKQMLEITVNTDQQKLEVKKKFILMLLNSQIVFLIKMVEF